jgi:allantoinase
VTECDLVLRAPRAITSAGEVPATIAVADGRIVAVEPYESSLRGQRTVELDDDLVLLPGLVDTHVHVNEPGRTEWEGFATATRAAAAGGITTVVDMPLNSIPATVDVQALETKRTAAEGQCFVDVGFWGGAIPGNIGALRELHDAGVFGVKCFLLDSGVPEFPHLGPAELEEYLGVLRGFGGLLLVHAEDGVAIDAAPAPDGRSYRGYLASRPREAEDLAVARVVEAARRTGGRAHVVHLSSADALPLIRNAQRDGVRITAETCPHYLTFTAEEIPDGATQYKCCPPIREADNQELLWRGLTEGTIDCVVSDHSPCTPELKRLDDGDFGLAWGGIAGLQVGLSAVWTGARRRGCTLTEVARWMAEGPARLAGLQRKGRIAVGYDADFCAFAPDAELVVDVATLRHKNPITPYAGRALAGVVRTTWLRGVDVRDDEAPRGELLSRGEA